MVSSIDVRSEEFLERKRNYLKLRNEFRDILKKNTRGGYPEAVKKHHARGKFLARKRVDLLLDPNTFFSEFSPRAAMGQYRDRFPSAGLVTGIGVIHGREAVVVANDATVKGGAYVAETIKKHLRAQEIAPENRLPCVYLVDSGGVFLPEETGVFPDRFDFGRIFYNQARFSAMGIPRISVAFKLAGMATKIGHARNTPDKTCRMKDQGMDYTGEAAMSKLYCFCIAGEVVDEAVQIHGGYGLMKDYAIERFYRDRRLPEIGEETSEILQLVISRKIGC